MPEHFNNPQIIVLGVTAHSILLQKNGVQYTIDFSLEALQALMTEVQATNIQMAGKLYNINSIGQANFNFIIGQSAYNESLPDELVQNLVTDNNQWPESLRRELLNKGIAVGKRPIDIFQHYGWLIETFLKKIQSIPGQERNLRRLSFMAEAFQASLRYLCYIQISQLSGTGTAHPLLKEFFSLTDNRHIHFDYLNLLLVSTDLLRKQEMFMPEIGDFVTALSDTKTALYNTALFLDNNRRYLLNQTIPEEEQLPNLLDEYLTALVFWLRQLSFLANYRLVSIKDISLSYRMGTPKNFVHLYGELHGMYKQTESEEDDYNARVIEGLFTYNQSVLLFKGRNADTCLDQIHQPNSYLSLSPLVIDQSVFLEKPTQTPEIFYYTGIGSNSRQYHFAQYRNELLYDDRVSKESNKTLVVHPQNNRQHKLDELFEHLEQVCTPFKTNER
jgi:hypothetical protein